LVPDFEAFGTGTPVQFWVGFSRCGSAMFCRNPFAADQEHDTFWNEEPWGDPFGSSLRFITRRCELVRALGRVACLLDTSDSVPGRRESILWHPVSRQAFGVDLARSAYFLGAICVPLRPQDGRLHAKYGETSQRHSSDFAGSQQVPIGRVCVKRDRVGSEKAGLWRNAH
jgi:hypothetical protein